MNHFMMAHIENFLIPDLLGIRRTGELIEIRPHPVSDLKWCKGSAMSAYGEVKVSWQVNDNTFTIDIDIPHGGFADVYLPYSGQAESIGDGHHHFEDTVPEATKPAKTGKPVKPVKKTTIKKKK